MSSPNFEAIRPLSTQDQRRLLDEGDPPERLWAAWALAQQLGQDALPLLRTVEQGEIPVGLRRQLLVVLAGLGERRLLETVTRFDSTDAVRATAATLYIRTGSAPSSEDVVGFASQQLRTGPVEVRRAVLCEQQAGNLELPTAVLLTALRDADSETRVLCAACVLSGSDAHQTVAAVVDAFADEPDVDARRRLLSKLPRSAVPHVLGCAGSLGPAAIVELLRAVHELFAPLVWHEVRCLSTITSLDIGRAILAYGVHPEPEDGLPWLCRLLRLTNSDDSSIGQDARWRCLSAIESSLTDETVLVLQAADKNMLRTMFETRLADWSTEVETEGPDSDDDIYKEDLESLIRLLR